MNKQGLDISPKHMEDIAGSPGRVNAGSANKKIKHEMFAS